MKDSQKRLLILGTRTMWLAAWSDPGNHERNVSSSMKYSSHQEGLGKQERQFKLIWQEKWYFILARVAQLCCSGTHNCLHYLWSQWPGDKLYKCGCDCKVYLLDWFPEINQATFTCNRSQSFLISTTFSTLQMATMIKLWLNERMTTSLWDAIFKFTVSFS